MKAAPARREFYQIGNFGAALQLIAPEGSAQPHDALQRSRSCHWAHQVQEPSGTSGDSHPEDASPEPLRL
jgi:hypothetical protein